MDRRQARIVTVLPTPNGGKRGTGYLLDPTLVVTAHHVGRTAATIQGPACTQGAAVELAWGDEALDVALLRTVLPVSDMQISPARLGRITSGAPDLRVEVIGYPVFQRVNSRWRIEQAIGTVNPITTSDIDRIQIQITSGRWIDPPGSKADPHPVPWTGASGAPVLVDDLLVGIVTLAQPRPPFDRLEATPINLLSHGIEAVDSTLRRVGTSVYFESVELVNITEPPRVDPPTHIYATPSQLLDPVHEVVEFVGREADLAKMTSWLASPVFSVGMMVGEVGAGKTRSALHLIRKAQHHGWNAELLAGKDTPARATREQLRRLSMLNTPTLIVIDNAELKPAYIAELARNLAYNRGIPVRLMMLSRSAGWWWKELQHQLPAAAVSDVQVFRLEHVADSGHNANALFAAAAESFDQHINKGSSLVVGTSILSASNDAHFGPEAAITMLNIHLRALRWVLAISSPETRDEPETALLSNELQHISRALRSNDIRMHSTRLETILAAAVLYGASTRAEAEQLMDSIPELDIDDGLLLAEIIRDFYPGRDGDFFSPLGIGALDDRLLTTNVLQSRDALLSPMPKLTRLQQMRALTTLFRLAAGVPKIGEIMAAFLNKRAGDIRFELAASAGLAVGQPGVIGTVLRRAYPSQSDRIRDVVTAVSGSSQGDNVSAELWDMYVGAFAAEGTGGVDIGPAYDAIESAMDDIDKCRSSLEEALATAPSLSNFLEDRLSILYESSRSLSRLADRLHHAEEDPQTIHSLSRKINREVEELHPILIETAEVLNIDIRKLSAFQDEGLSQISSAIRDLADSLDRLEQAVPVSRGKEED